MNKDEINTKEISRLIDWLKEHGHTHEELSNVLTTSAKNTQKKTTSKRHTKPVPSLTKCTE